MSPASNWLARDEFDRGAQELRSLGLRARSYGDPTVFAKSAGTYLVRRRADSPCGRRFFARAWIGSVDCRADRRSAADTAASICCRCSTSRRSRRDAEAVHRLQRPDLAPLVADMPVRHHPALARSDARGAPCQGPERGLRRARPSLRFCCRWQEGRALTTRRSCAILHAGGEAAGPLFGGTIAQLTASLGTPYAFDPPHGCILFFEDVNERPYRLDRMLTQLRLAGILARGRPRARLRPDARMRRGQAARSHGGGCDRANVRARVSDGPVLTGLSIRDTRNGAARDAAASACRVRVVTSPRRSPCADCRGIAR